MYIHYFFEFRVFPTPWCVSLFLCSSVTRAVIPFLHCSFWWPICTSHRWGRTWGTEAWFFLGKATVDRDQLEMVTDSEQASVFFWGVFRHRRIGFGGENGIVFCCSTWYHSSGFCLYYHHGMDPTAATICREKSPLFGMERFSNTTGAWIGSWGEQVRC